MWESVCYVLPPVNPDIFVIILFSMSWIISFFQVKTLKLPIVQNQHIWGYFLFNTRGSYMLNLQSYSITQDFIHQTNIQSFATRDPTYIFSSRTLYCFVFLIWFLTWTISSINQTKSFSLYENYPYIVLQYNI